MKWLAHQGLDFLGYLFLPFVCFLLPAKPAALVANWVSRRSFAYRAESFRAFSNASAVQEISDPKSWQATFRLVRFVDSVDVWHGMFSSDRRIERSLVTDPDKWPEADHIVLLGTHLGPSSLLLRRLASAGFRPRFVFRDLPIELRRARPVYYLYLRLRMRYLKKVCLGGAISVPGGRDEVARAMEEPGCALILLIDAPASGGNQTNVQLMNSHLPISRRGLEMACSKSVLGAFFSVRWSSSQQRRVIEMGEARPLKDCPELIRQSEGFIQRTVSRNPAQWQLWLTATPILKPLP